MRGKRGEGGEGGEKGGGGYHEIGNLVPINAFPFNDRRIYRLFTYWRTFNAIIINYCVKLITPMASDQIDPIKNNS